MQTKRKKRDIDHMKHMMTDYISDAAYWHLNGDYEQYLKAIFAAVEMNHRIIARRKRFF